MATSEPQFATPLFTELSKIKPGECIALAPQPLPLITAGYFGCLGFAKGISKKIPFLCPVLGCIGTYIYERVLPCIRHCARRAARKADS